MVYDAVSWPAPAKLNLLLRILARRQDGYHQLQTVFQFLDLCDQLSFRLRPDGEIKRHAPLPGVSAADDLTLRAARLLQRHAQIKQGVEITLEKRIPLGGGLGGGSSDAATTLVALNRLWGCRLAPDELAALGLRLGADVPIFLHGRAAWAEGIGEIFTPCNPPEEWYLLLFPGCEVSTATIFQHSELTRDANPVTIADFASGAAVNDALPLVRKLYPQVEQAMQWLEQHGEGRMTGTGSTLFARCASEVAARQRLQQLPKPFTGMVVRGTNCSPLLEREMRSQ